MRSANRVFINSTSSELRRVFGLSLSSVTTDEHHLLFTLAIGRRSALSVALWCSGDGRRGGFDSLYHGNAQPIRAILLATANETSQNGRRPISALIQAECRPSCPAVRASPLTRQW